MGILMKVNGTVFTNTVGVADFPIIPQLKALFFMGDTLEKSTMDKSGNSNSATVAGTVTVDEHYATFEGTGNANYFRCGNAVASDATKVAGIALVRKNNESRGVICADAANKGFAFCTNRIMYKDSSAWRNLSFSWGEDSGFYPLAWKIDETGIYMYRLTDNGLVLVNSVAGGTLVPNAINVRIGGTQNNWTMNGTADIAVAAYYEGEITLDDLKDALMYCKAYGEKNGLTVI